MIKKWCRIGVISQLNIGFRTIFWISVLVL